MMPQSRRALADFSELDYIFGFGRAENRQAAVPAHNITVAYHTEREMEQKHWQLPKGIKRLLCVPAAAGYPETY